ncbi:MAG: hypothetical protein GXP13_08590 [Gammaproteobacteria bacterium]|nr:hypothetical protein [Gammaproteobacteria bacterium]
MVKIVLWILFYAYLNSVGVVYAEDTPASAVKEYTLFVDEMDKRVSTKKISASYKLSAQEVFTRQFLTIQYRLESNDSFITLDIDYQNTPGTGAIPLNVKKEKTGNADGFKYRYLLDVKYFMTRAGDQTLIIPPLIYSEGGKVIHRIGFKSQIINNKPLPPYLPPYIAVGDIELESDFPKAESWLGLYETDKVYYWDIYLRGQDITPDVLPEIRQQLRSNNGIQFLPAETKRSTIKGFDEVTQQIHYSIPFVLKSNGWVMLPTLRLQSFDAKTQRINNKQYVFKTVYVFNYYALWMFDVLMLALLFFVTWKILPLLLSVIRKTGILIAARQQIRQAENPVQLRKGMNLLAGVFNWPENITLEKWIGYWCRDIKNHKNPNGVISPLNAGLYSDASIEDERFADVKKFVQRPVLRQYWICFVLSCKTAYD